ncbi:MAG: hypothetical protein RL758_42 [Pseudomonadota bacterium]|jgi:transposase-like protein
MKHSNKKHDETYATTTVADAQAEKPRPDWNPIRLAYLHSNKTLAQVAKEFGVTPEAVEKRCEREGWAKLRRDASEAVGRAANEKIEAKRAEELAQQNDADLRVAKALRGQVVAAINSAAQNAKPLRPVEIRQLAGAAAEIQKVVRLALGATTENTGVSNPDGGPVETVAGSLEEYQAALRRIASII